MTAQTPRPAWQIDRELRLTAVPRDRRLEASQWYTSETAFPTGDDLIAMFWEAHVPGSGAPEIPYVEMVQALGNRGYDVTAAEALLPEGLRLAQTDDRDSLRVLTARLLAALHAAPPDPTAAYWRFEHPAAWEEVRAAMTPAAQASVPAAFDPTWEGRILAGWLGQLAGGAFGTAIEGYHYRQIAAVYGPLDAYIGAPETMNDDVTYELAFLDAYERLGGDVTSEAIALEWVRQIPFGWSAEWVALHNLNDGIMPPASGSWRNPYSDWIGVQMRGMICGLVSPGWPLEAARLAHLDGVISHAANGVYGGMFAAVLTSLAFTGGAPRTLIAAALDFLPQRSEYVAVARECLAVLADAADPARAWEILDRRLERYNWIHAYPNLAADLLALWHCHGDLTAAFRLLASAGMDVDCNAGLVGTVLGVLHGTPPQWAEPLHDTLETYLPGKERLSIRELAARTARLARRTERPARR
jgi:ADP-ribosylglycohydrolase